MKFSGIFSPMTVADRWLFVGLILASILSFAAVDFGNEPAHVAVVNYGDEQRLTKSLKQDEIFTVRGPLGTTRIEISAKEIRILESACPQKLCILQGEISRAGEILVCAPNGVAIWLEGKRVNEFDAITG